MYRWTVHADTRNITPYIQIFSGHTRVFLFFSRLVLSVFQEPSSVFASKAQEILALWMLWNVAKEKNNSNYIIVIVSKMCLKVLTMYSDSFWKRCTATMLTCKTTITYYIVAHRYTIYTYNHTSSPSIIEMIILLGTPFIPLEQRNLYYIWSLQMACPTALPEDFLGTTCTEDILLSILRRLFEQRFLYYGPAVC